MLEIKKQTGRNWNYKNFAAANQKLIGLCPPAFAAKVLFLGVGDG